MLARSFLLVLAFVLLLIHVIEGLALVFVLILALCIVGVGYELLGELRMLFHELLEFLGGEIGQVDHFLALLLILLFVVGHYSAG